ncbi:MAG: hypothetical protein ACPG79_01050 [Poseidonia sp.]
MLGSILVLLVPSLLPGWALASVLDGSGDRLRKALLSPALGLLLLYGVSGGLLLLNVWSLWAMVIAFAALNTVAWRLVYVRHEEVSQRSHWQRLEAAMHGEVSETITATISEEAGVQLEFQKNRHLPLMALSLAVAGIALLSPFLQTYPFGVDWIGFAVLSQQIAVDGNLMLSGTNEGFWTYPPAFPSLASWVVSITGTDAGQAVFHLGHYTLFVLLIGLMGAFDRHGAGAYAVLSMGLGLGLFAKTFDSGYPSVASQLGLIVGVLVLLRPSQERQRHHTLGLCMALLCIAMIHPTGAIYLALFMLSHVIHGFKLDDEEHQELVRRFAYVVSAFITFGFALALLVIAPRLFEEAVFSEYGWQGGRPLLVYNGFVLLAAMFAAIGLRATLEARIITTWFACLWLLSCVHLVEGLQNIPILSLLSYTLYSMALHAFHVPLALLVALWWSPKTNLTPVNDDVEIRWPSMPESVGLVVLSGVLLGALFAPSIALSLSQHDELQAVAPGDHALRERLGEIEGAVYTENMHWGYVWNAPEGVQTTSIPTLGLVYLTAGEQTNATRAIYADNVSYFRSQNMNHALTSPLGSIQWALAVSPYWERLIEVDGAALWVLVPEGDADVSLLSGIDGEDCVACVSRLDPWRDHRFRDPMNLGDERPFLAEGTPAKVKVSSPTAATKLCMTYEVIGEVNGLYIQSSSGLERPFHALRQDAGYHQGCFDLDADSTIEHLNISWKADEPTRWVNPLGLSGRDTVLIDRTGVRFHWIEWQGTSS